MAPEVMQQMIKRWWAVVLVLTLAVWWYFVYDMMNSSSSETVVTDDWEDRDNLDDFLWAQTGATVSSWSATGWSATGTIQTWSRGGWTLEREGEVVSNIVIGSWDNEIGSWEEASSWDVVPWWSGRLAVEDLFDQLLAWSPISWATMNQSWSTNINLSGEVQSSTWVTNGSSLSSWQTWWWDAWWSWWVVWSSESSQSWSVGLWWGQQPSVLPQSNGATGAIVPAVFPSTGTQSVSGAQSGGGSQPLPTTLPVSDDRLMEHYRQRKKTQ